MRNMKQVDCVVDEIIRRFRFRGHSCVEGYNKFGYVRDAGRSVVVSRETGKNTVIPFKKLCMAVEAMRIDHNLYHMGPTGLRKYGITHINSPVWSLLHLLTIEELIN